MVEGDGLDELEYKNLLGAISSVEVLLAYAAPGVRPLYESFLNNAKSQLDFLKKKVEGRKEEQEKHDQQQASMMQLAQKEAALSQSEKEIYSGFLEKDFFTKRDFRTLEQFYSNTWDRLSDGGKQEMSHRVWEGIRHDEYRFTELPKVVQEKESKLAYRDLTDSGIASDGRLTRIPEADRNAFVRAYRDGNREEAYHVLDRDVFRQNMAVETATGVKHHSAAVGREADDQAIVSKIKSGAAKPRQSDTTPSEASAMANINLESVDLSGVQLADSISAPAAAAIPDASRSRVNAR